MPTYKLRAFKIYQITRSPPPTAMGALHLDCITASYSQLRCLGNIGVKNNINVFSTKKKRCNSKYK